MPEAERTIRLPEYIPGRPEAAEEYDMHQFPQLTRTVTGAG